MVTGTILISTDDILQGRVKGKTVQLPDDVKRDLATSLSHELVEYHGKYFDESLGVDQTQAPEWLMATTSYCDFLDRHFDVDTVCLSVKTLAKSISFTTFIGTSNFREFTNRYRKFLRERVDNGSS